MRKNEPNFKVEFPKGLDEIVAQATSQRPGTFVLGEMDLPEPVAKLQVYLQPSASSLGGNAGYVLGAKIIPCSKQKLDVNPHDFSDFELRKFNSTYSLKSSLLPSYSSIDVRTKRPGNERGIDVYSFVAYGGNLTKSEVGNAVSAFAKALETAVNSAYHSARKASPKLTLKLVAGEEVKKIATKPTGQATLTRMRNPEDAAVTEEAVKVSLDALTSNVSFADIGGYQNVKDELTMFLLGIKNPEMAKRHGYTPAKGVMLYGPSGTGKTLFGKAIAGEAGAQFFYVDPTELLDKYVGESPKALRHVFENAATAAKENRKPVIMFIDEIDAILLKRSSHGGSDAVTSQLVNVFNQYMDGFKTGKIQNVYVVAATNRLNEMDEAAVRPPRFVHIEVPLPDLEARTAIFQVAAKSLEKDAGTALFSPKIDYSSLAKQTEGFSGADIANVLRELRKDAFGRAAREGLKEPKMTSTDELKAAVRDYKPGSATNKGPIGFVR